MGDSLASKPKIPLPGQRYMHQIRFPLPYKKPVSSARHVGIPSRTRVAGKLSYTGCPYKTVPVRTVHWPAFPANPSGNRAFLPVTADEFSQCPIGTKKAAPDSSADHHAQNDQGPPCPPRISVAKNRKCCHKRVHR